MPRMWGMERRNQEVAPEAVSMTLLGPGVIDMTKEYVANGRGSTMADSIRGPAKIRRQRLAGGGTDCTGGTRTVPAGNRYGTRRSTATAGVGFPGARPPPAAAAGSAQPTHGARPARPEC